MDNKDEFEVHKDRVLQLGQQIVAVMKAIKFVMYFLLANDLFFAIALMYLAYRVLN